MAALVPGGPVPGRSVESYRSFHGVDKQMHLRRRVSQYLSRNHPRFWSRGFVHRLKHLQTKLLSAFDYESNLLFSVPRFVKFCAFVEVLLAIRE